MKSSGQFELRYALKEKIPDLEVLSVDDAHPVKQVCMQGNEVRVLIKEKDENWEEVKKTGWDNSVNWHVVSQGKIGQVTEQPSTCQILGEKDDLPEEMRAFPWLEREPRWKIQSGKDFIRTGKYKDQEGLWRCQNGIEPKLFLQGNYFGQLVSPDGRWLVTAKKENGSEEINKLVRINLLTKKEIVIESDFTYPFIPLPITGKILFPRYSEANRREHVLLNPATGSIQILQGEFEPLEQQITRPLQPIQQSSEYWAAIPNREKNLTKIGRYNIGTFKFFPVLELPEIIFSSMDMWVDETANQIYIVYNGHLLRLPFNAKALGIKIN